MITPAGDAQADLTVHGGEHQAVYSYPVEHYSHWERVTGVKPYAPGTFGENFTVSGLLEAEVCIGDVWSIGRARLQVTMPRLPCFKFGYKIGRSAILKEFLHSGFSGYYHPVLVEAFVTAGDSIELVDRDPCGITVRRILGMQKLGKGDGESLKRALELDGLPPYLRRDLEMRLSAMKG